MEDCDEKKSPDSDQPQSGCHQNTDIKINVKQKLSAYVHRHRKQNSTELNIPDGSQDVCDTSHDQTSVSVISEVTKGDLDGNLNRTGGAPEGEPMPQPLAPCGSFLAGSQILSNSILDEVLNEKKLALLQSPEVISFLKEKQKCANKYQHN